MAIEHGKSRAELGFVLRTLSALDLPLTIDSGDRLPRSGDDILPVDIDAIVNAVKEDRKRPSFLSRSPIVGSWARPGVICAAGSHSSTTIAGGAWTLPIRSLPIPLVVAEHDHAEIEPWLWGPLPDNEAILTRCGQRFHVSPRNAFALLGAVGEDCHGAVQLVRAERQASCPRARPPETPGMRRPAQAACFRGRAGISGAGGSEEVACPSWRPSGAWPPPPPPPPGDNDKGFPLTAAPLPPLPGSRQTTPRRT